MEPNDRPSWLTEPCPHWCTRRHLEDDHPEDRIHQDDGHLVPGVVADISHVSLARHARGTTLLLQCTQRVDESVPWLLMSDHDAPRSPWLLDLTTARRLAASLLTTCVDAQE